MNSHRKAHGVSRLRTKRIILKKVVDYIEHARQNARQKDKDMNAGKAFNATREGQQAMSARASRIATLRALNSAIRKVNAAEAYPDAMIDATPDGGIDAMLETLRQDYNRLLAYNQQTTLP